MSKIFKNFNSFSPNDHNALCFVGYLSKLGEKMYATRYYAKIYRMDSRYIKKSVVPFEVAPNCMVQQSSMFPRCVRS